MARTYLDPRAAYPRPQICPGRGELAAALAQQAERGLRAQLEEVIGHGDKVVAAAQTPGRTLTASASPTTMTTPCSACGRANRRPMRLPDRAEALTPTGVEVHP